MPPDAAATAAELTLLLSDVVDSTALAVQLGEQGISALWAAHDAAAHALLQRWRGREIDKTDGLLLMFEASDDALAYAQAYHQALAGLQPPLRARIGLHRGPVVCRPATPQAVALGTKPLELDGAAKAIVARIMALAQGGQTLLSDSACRSLATPPPLRALGHWRLKGLPAPQAPLALYEPLDEQGRAAAPPPTDHDKAYRVHWRDGLWATAAEGRHHLPAERDRFIGREGPLQALAQRLDQGHRLVSLLGPGGSGKTRLALRYAHGWRGDFAGGAWWCELSAARSLDGLVHAVAQGLDLPLGKTDPVAQIGQALASRGPVLVLLDNFEQVVALAETTLGRWLDAAPQARFLVTSRETLQIRGESLFWLDPLPETEALAMLCERAGLAEPSAAADLAALVQLLDGLPLAIELAAARLSVVSPAQMLPLLQDRFAVLRRSGRAPAGDRQATLEATLDWSWSLLRPAEQALLVQLTVFEGGCDLQGALAVLQAPPGDTVLDLLARLVHQCMLKAEVRADGGERYTLLPTLQAYALRQQGRQASVDDSVLATCRQRHSRHYAACSEAVLIRNGFRDSQNILAACLATLDGSDLALAVQALESAWRVVQRRGPLGLGRQWAERLAQRLQDAGTGDGSPSGDGGGAASDANSEAAMRCRVAWVQASACMAMGQYAPARPLLAQARAWAPQIDEPGLRARLQAGLQAKWAEMLSRDGLPDEALACAADALAAAKQAGDGETICLTGNALGALQWEIGRLPEALQTFTATLAVAETLASPRWRAGLVGNVAMIEHQSVEPPGDETSPEAEAQRQAQRAAARNHYRRAIELAEACGERRWASNAQCNLGLMLCEAGELEEAESLLLQSLQTSRDLGQQAVEATVHCNLGLVALGRNHASAARKSFFSSMEIARRTEDKPLISQCTKYLKMVVEMESFVRVGATGCDPSSRPLD